ncbi:hypothetical protein [Saccharopolyspora erythraea]|nr:hypothetical protein [Saccharopolyspora erythraea]
MFTAHNLEAEVMDPEEFLAELRELVRDEAPKVFALCEEVGDRDDGYVRYWGMAFDDSTRIVSPFGEMTGSFQSPERAHVLLSREQPLHLVWA